MNTEHPFYVYAHIRKDTNEIFYIGKGATKNNRAYSKNSRSVHWYNIVHTVGYKVEILHWFLTETEANECEKDLIQKIGRRDLGKGPLINYTDGGEGQSGILRSAETRLKSSLSKLGALNPMYGKKASPETLALKSASLSGRNHPQATKVTITSLDGSTIDFDTQKDACKHLNIAKSQLSNYFNGKKKLPKRLSGILIERK